MKKQIAIVVDDFGEHATINAAALELARTGRISAISCMTGGPAWLRGAAALGEFERNHLDLGLHLDLTQYPLGRSAWQLADLIAMGVLRRLNRRLIRDQVERQCDAFEAAVGRPPDHVDGHQHVHQLPQVRELLVDTLYRRYNPRPWLRETRRARSVGLPADVVQMESQVKSAIIEWLGATGLRHLAARSDFRQNRHLLGIHSLHADERGYRHLLNKWLRTAATGDLLVTHPATPGGPVGTMATNRTAEYVVLNSSVLTDHLRETQTEVVRMSRLLTAV